ncbi:DUF3276 family protein [Halocola ammonii]
MSDGRNNREDIYSKAIRAGKRTYFFDVKSTKGSDLYLTITESKRKYNDDGKFFYEKHKLFLYKEDFDKFADGLTETIDKIRELQATDEFLSEDDSPRNDAYDNDSDGDETPKFSENGNSDSKRSDEEFSDVKFEDLED